LPLKNLSIFCADVGSIKAKKFGWAAKLLDGRNLVGNNIENFAQHIADEITRKSKAARGRAAGRP